MECYSKEPLMTKFTRFMFIGLYSLWDELTETINWDHVTTKATLIDEKKTWKRKFCYIISLILLYDYIWFILFCAIVVIGNGKRPARPGPVENIWSAGWPVSLTFFQFLHYFFWKIDPKSAFSSNKYFLLISLTISISGKYQTIVFS
jgi:hypothetical protein